MTKPFRIAVCLSGQPRTWRACAPSIRRFFESSGYQVDYFIATWDTDSWWRNKKPFLKPADLDGLEDAFRPISLRVNPLPASGRAWEGLFESFRLSVHDKTERELTQGFTYDAVIKGRLDCVFDPQVSFCLPPVEPMTAYAVNRMERMPHEYYGANFSDMWFYSGSVEMDIIADCMRGASFEDHEDYGPGVLLWNHMTRYGIHPATSSVLSPNVIVREEFGHLDGINDFNHIRETFPGWAGR